MKKFEFAASYTLKEMEEHLDGMAHLAMPDSSMRPRIRRGDWVIYDKYLKEIYQEPTPLVVKLNGHTLVREATQDENGVITLRSCSSKIDPITVADDDDLVIVGRVYGMVRGAFGKGKKIPYPQPQKRINDDPMGFGKSGAAAYDTLPPAGTIDDELAASDEAKYLMNIDPALYTVARFLRDAPEGTIERFIMQDESMMDFIVPGDVLLCDNRLKEPDPKYALLFVVKIDGEATVREVWRDTRGRIRIRPHDPKFPCFIIEKGDDFEIVGKLVSVAELSLRETVDGEPVNNMKMKLLPTPRMISVSEP